MSRILVIARNIILSAVLAWLGLEFSPDKGRDAEPASPAPAEEPAE
jgi:hypothetical protein